MTASLLPAIASSLALWPGLLLAAGGLAKAVDLASDDVQDTVLHGWWPAARRCARPGVSSRRRSWRSASWSSPALAVPWPEAAAALLLGGAALVAVWGLRNAPDAGCGCFGARATATVSARTAVRAGFLAALAAVAAVGGASWTSVLDDPAAAAAPSLPAWRWPG